MDKDNKTNFKDSVIISGKSLAKSLPMIIGTLLLISLISVLVPESFYTKVFSKNIFWDSLIGSILGSISAGTPITSYIFGGELLAKGISLIAVTAFLVSWVTVGIIQLPAEMSMLGKKFALLRNLSAFVLAIVCALITVLILEIL